jgi:hypothetical protein
LRDAGRLTPFARLARISLGLTGGNHMVKRRILFSLAAVAALGGCSALPASAAAGPLIDVQIVDRSRNDVLSEYRHRGITYVAGRPGDRYAVRLTNRSAARVLVVLSVDGVNAISGETAATAQTGYVLSPWQSADITGWRKSDAEAAAFYFTALPDSYAARTGRPHNVGVIGAAVFRERVPLPRPQPFDAVPYGSGDRTEGAARQESEQRANNDAGAARNPAEAPAADSPAAAAGSVRERDASSTSRTDKLGTGHGEREYAPIGRTAFERASAQPAQIVQVRYDSHANLVASGVIRTWPAVPDPFPGFVPDPPS